MPVNKQLKNESKKREKQPLHGSSMFSSVDIKNLTVPESIYCDPHNHSEQPESPDKKHGGCTIM